MASYSTSGGMTGCPVIGSNSRAVVISTAGLPVHLCTNGSSASGRASSYGGPTDILKILGTGTQCGPFFLNVQEYCRISMIWHPPGVFAIAFEVVGVDDMMP